jgi:hypothetical protein
MNAAQLAGKLGNFPGKWSKATRFLLELGELLAKGAMFG